MCKVVYAQFAQKPMIALVKYRDGAILVNHRLIARFRYGVYLAHYSDIEKTGCAKHRLSDVTVAQEALQPHQRRRMMVSCRILSNSFFSSSSILFSSL